MNPTLAHAAAFALDLAIKATLVFAVTAGLLFALRRASAATRHLVGTFGLAAALLLPVLTLALPRVPVRLIPDLRPFPAAPVASGRVAKAPPTRMRPDDAITVDVVAPAPVPSVKAWRRLARAVPERDAASPSDSSTLSRSNAPARRLRLPSAGTVLALTAGLWVLGALAFSARLAVGWARIRRIARGASPLGDAEWIEERDAAARRLELARPVPLLESEAIPVAVTSGWRRPLLLIGNAARSWAVERKRVVLLHELAHVKRADWPALLVAELAVAMYWFHPASWWLGRRVRREAEQACDDLVIAAGTKPSVYAGHLLGIFRSLHSPAHPVAPALAIARPHHFEERLRAILDPSATRSGASGFGARLAAAGLFVAAASFSAVEPWKATSVSTDPTIASAGNAHIAVQIEKKEKKAIAYRFEQKTETRVDKIEKTVCPSKRDSKPGAAPEADASAAPEPGAEAKAEAEAEAGAQPEASTDGESVPAVWKPDAKAPAPAGFKTASNRKGRHDGSEAYQRGMGLHHDGDYEGAIQEFQRAIDDGYNEETAAYNIACGYARLGNNDQAFEWLKKAMDLGFDVASYLGRDDDLDSLKSDPRWAQTKKEARAQEGSKAGREARSAAARYQRVLAKNPSNGEPFFDAGLDLLRSDQYELAVDAYQHAIDLGYRTGTAFYNQACAHALNGDKDKAFDSLRKALDSGFDQPDTFAKDDDLESLHGDPRFADLKREAKELSLPGYNSGFWGHRSSDRTKWRNAAKRFESYVQKHPDSGRGWYSLGFASLAGDWPEPSIEAFQKALALGYRKPVTMYNIACAYSRLDQKDAAFDWLFKALDAGFDETGTIRSDEDLDNLRGDARYRKALSMARAKERAGEDNTD